MRWSHVICGVVLILITIQVIAEAPPSPQVTAVEVAWNYGSEPGKESDRWLGQRSISVRYEPPECASTFELQALRHEYVLLDRQTGKKSAPAFIVARFLKSRPGAASPPSLDIVRPEYSARGKRTKKSHVDSVVFRMDFPPNRVPNWEAGKVEVSLSAPNHDLHNPTDWTEVVVRCD